MNYGSELDHCGGYLFLYPICILSVSLLNTIVVYKIMVVLLERICGSQRKDKTQEVPDLNDLNKIGRKYPLSTINVS